MIELNAEQVREKIKNGEDFILDCYAPWCGPCKMIGPVIDEIAEELAGKVTVAKVNVDDCPAISAEHRISAIPTIMIFRDGQLVDRSTGLASKAALLEKLK